MAISLKDVEARVAELEKGGSSGWNFGNSENSFWMQETASKLLIQWGVVTKTSDNVLIKFIKNFTNTNYSVLTCQNHLSGTSDTNAAIPMCKEKTVSTFVIRAVHPQGYGIAGAFGWIAIGYLISNRLKSMFSNVISRFYTIYGSVI